PPRSARCSTTRSRAWRTPSRPEPWSPRTTGRSWPSGCWRSTGPRSRPTPPRTRRWPNPRDRGLPSAPMWWIVGVVAVVVVLATYLTWIASRIDRLHARAAASGAALDSALLRRAVAAIDLADETHRPDLRALARTAVARDEASAADRENAENALTKGLR